MSLNFSETSQQSLYQVRRMHEVFGRRRENESGAAGGKGLPTTGKPLKTEVVQVVEANFPAVGIS